MQIRVSHTIYYLINSIKSGQNPSCLYCSQISSRSYSPHLLSPAPQLRVVEVWMNTKHAAPSPSARQYCRRRRRRRLCFVSLVMAMTESFGTAQALQDGECSSWLKIKYIRQERDEESCGYVSKNESCYPGFYSNREGAMLQCSPGWFCPREFVWYVQHYVVLHVEGLKCAVTSCDMR